MQPLQLWLPALGSSLGRPEVAADAQRAFGAWRGETRVWLLPDLDRPSARWAVAPGIFELAMRSELIDALDVYHIDERGRAVGPWVKGRFPNGQVDGLLDAWLNVGKHGGCQSFQSPKEITLRIPRIGKREVIYQEVKIPLEPGPSFPVEVIEADKKTARLAVFWPPKDRPIPPTVFPSAESLRSPDPFGSSVSFINVWPKPIGPPMGFLSDFDDLFAQGQMVAIARKDANDHAGALQAARHQAGPYLSEGHTTLEWAWFYPTRWHEGDQGVAFAAEARFNLSSGDGDELDKAIRSRPWQSVLARRVPIRRAWGALGLFWSLLLNRLEATEGFAVCERCGHLSQGKRGKRFCGPKDNADCYRARRAEDRRRERRAL